MFDLKKMGVLSSGDRFDYEDVVTIKGARRRSHG